jgi:L-threonylcarbamoyladenylate synthase
MASNALQTEIVSIDPLTPDSEVLARAAAILQRGGLVAFPTETVYGLGAHALDADAVARIFTAKGRPSNNPLIVHVPDVEQAKALVTDWPETASRLAEQFWPGPLTLILPKSAVVPEIVTAGGPTVALRVPAHPVAQALLRTAQIPIAAPSANRSMRLSPTRAEHVIRDLSGRIAMILDGGPTPGGLESTVLDLTTTPPRLLRPGPIAPAEVEACIGPVSHARTDSETGEAPLSSPGMLARHYAPRTPLELVDADDRERVPLLLSQGERVGWVVFAPVSAPESEALTVVVLPSDPRRYAAQLYATLHTLDQSGVTRIVVAQPPDMEAWLAVHDRLRRAATPDKDRLHPQINTD